MEERSAGVGGMPEGPVDPDVPERELCGAARTAEPARTEQPEQPRRTAEPQWPVVLAVAAGGACGATARYAASLLWPTPDGGFPLTVLSVNVVGCALFGVLMVLVTEVWPTPGWLVRPFLGTGVLGGFTTFSTYAADFEQLVRGARPGVGLAYLAATLLAALAAVRAGVAVTRRVTAGRRAAR